jgi:DNA-binding PadR family transcriptional regulator
MPTRRLTWLEEWILCWLQADAQRSKALLAASAQQLLGGFARQEQQQICTCLASLETKGLIVVGRTPGGKPAYLLLTAAGSQYVSRVPRRLEV